MKWTDEAIDYQLSAISSMRRNDKPFDAVTLQLEAALIELKRVRAWVKRIGCGTDCDWARMRLAKCLNGDPAPTDEQEDKR